MGAGPMTRVVVVDDQTLVRQGIVTLLELAGVEVVGQADDGAAALDVIEQQEPDVVLLDLRMPRHDGIWTLERLRERACPVPALILTTFDDDTLVLDALRAGARGYLLKDVTVEQLARAVRTLADGGTLIAPSITDRLLRAIQDGPAPVGAESPVAIQELTGRELEVLRLMAEGYSNREIAAALNLADGTVKNHVSTILLKLAARDRTNAVLRALHDGLLR
ncbi:DNA-binding response regulator, NarL/FixJ family, contains REC and HTH domains [Saccharopolyspora antimicrobica]|uniref:DNA-binding response regulator, NarL/FixJ family, contains REC and HTH domains n=2 Tax=Saccharopolyspora antimicrobica TaxID=455193 RepID=A0A1I5JVH4_9PSEU|nr:LuxR family two component transcriptional regulator [Saccharopolyspora antimicrobica]SFO76778.1 DNA-binding response regulator, NarL/FixJ family, contains REC and HTH domains [Saccharopolyspora antimicrobica]